MFMRRPTVRRLQLTSSAEYVLNVEKYTIFYAMVANAIKYQRTTGKPLPFVIMTGCGYPALSVR